MKQLIFTSNMLNIVNFYIRVNLSLRDAAFGILLNFHVWSLSIRCLPLKLCLSNLSKKTKNILLFINFTAVKSYQAKHMDSLICFVFLRPPQAHQIAHYSALGMHTITCLNTCKHPARCVIITRLCFSYVKWKLKMSQISSYWRHIPNKQLQYCFSIRTTF